jgi:hypothetical protein
MSSSTALSMPRKVEIFRRRFSGLGHVYGTYNPSTGRSWQVKAPVSERVIENHLLGKQPFGLYLLVNDKTQAAAVDFDNEDANPPCQFMHTAHRYGLRSYIERSKSKGYHVWIFFQTGGVPAVKARRVISHILDEMDISGIEVFPKQDALPVNSNSYGNFINAPLFGRLVPEGRTVFLDPARGLEPHPNQWELIEGIKSVTEFALDEIIELNGLRTSSNTQWTPVESLGVYRGKGTLPPCAKKMLVEGVIANQRVACFWLAVHLRRVGLPFDLAVAALCEWTHRNRPTHGKTILSENEVLAQSAAAFLKEYNGYGCDQPAIVPYCNPSCPIYTQGCTANLGH